VKEEFTFHIDHPPNRVRRMLEEAALATPGVLRDPAPDSRTVAYDGISVRYALFFWIEEYGPVARIRNRFMTRVYYHAKRHGLKWPTPQRELLHYEGPVVEAARTVSADGCAEKLKALPAFAVLPDESIEALAHAASLLHYGEDEWIMRVGEKEQGLHVLTEGEVAIAIEDTEGNEQEITHLGKGDVFGETGLFSRPISVVNATALTDVELLLIPHRAMNDIISKQPRFAAEMSTLIEERKKLIRRAQPEDLPPTPVPSVDGKAA
ncbi:MAG: cyclic nucleotide-binding domain-containing protein, partial [Chloroflexota bacterium]|nr:cyclic nucleotide-binding domain-containing protein [Chloroflexota bacterium]